MLPAAVENPNQFLQFPADSNPPRFFSPSTSDDMWIAKAILVLMVTILVGVGFVGLSTGMAGRERADDPTLKKPARSPAPSEIPLPRESIPSCEVSFDFNKNSLLLTVRNTSNSPISYLGYPDREALLRVDCLIDGQWVVYTGIGCHDARAWNVIEPGKSTVFPYSADWMLWRSRFHATFRNADGNQSEVLLGEYAP